MNKLFLMAVVGLLGAAGYVVSKRPDIKQPKAASSFAVIPDCRTNTVSWTGAPSGAGSIALFATSKTRRSTQAVANIPATRSKITADDASNPDNLPMFISNDRTIDPDDECSPMFSYIFDFCYGDLEITAFAIQDPILVEKEKGYNNPSPLKIRDLAASKALDSTSITVQCPMP